jgi:hypothetical protein
MKKLVILFALLFAIPISAQIVLEHTYDNVDVFRYVCVDSNELMYYTFGQSGGLSVNIYLTDHSIYKTVNLPKLNGASYYKVVDNFTRHLFNTDDKIEFLATSSNNNVYILNEDGDSIFSCLNCYPNFPEGGAGYDLPQAVINTPTGAKMFLIEPYQGSERKMFVYSLPGKLPTSNTKLSVTDAPTIISSSSPSTSAYPNPSNGKIRVAYSLPEGLTTGELIITTTDGREVKRYRVGNMFNDILIEKSELANGAYFYSLVTERGQSEARKFVITN